MTMAMIPVCINGALSEMDEAQLEKREGGHENDNEIASWVEYWYDGALVHRSAHVHLKEPVLSMGEAARFG